MTSPSGAEKSPACEQLHQEGASSSPDGTGDEEARQAPIANAAGLKALPRCAWRVLTYSHAPESGGVAGKLDFFRGMALAPAGGARRRRAGQLAPVDSAARAWRP